MLKKAVLLSIGVLAFFNLCASGYTEEKDASKRPKQILFEGRIIEVKDWDYWDRIIKRRFFKEGGTVGEIDFGKIFPAVPEEIKDRQKLRLLSYVTTTAISGQTAQVRDTVPITRYTIKNSQPCYEEDRIGTTFIFLPCIEPESPIITVDLEVNYRYVAGWEEFDGTPSKKTPRILEISNKTAFMLKSGETIVLGGGAAAYKEIEDIKDRGRILALVTMKIQDVAQ